MYIYIYINILKGFSNQQPDISSIIWLIDNQTSEYFSQRDIPVHGQKFIWQSSIFILRRYQGG